MKNNKLLIKSVLLVFLISSGFVLSEGAHKRSEQETKTKQEHPKEHPTEHPSNAESKAVTKDNLARAIRRHIKSTSALNKGFYLAIDDNTERALKLTLVKVHDDKLASLGNQTYFACADFKADNGKIYDLDVFMKGESVDELTPTEVSVHKEDGVERYTWVEKRGVWRKSPLNGK